MCVYKLECVCLCVCEGERESVCVCVSVCLDCFKITKCEASERKSGDERVKKIALPDSVPIFFFKKHQSKKYFILAYIIYIKSLDDKIFKLALI